MLLPLRVASAEAASPASLEVAVLAASAAQPRLPRRQRVPVVELAALQEKAALVLSAVRQMPLLQQAAESVEQAASPGAAAPARQASRYSDSLFRQPLISFFILSFIDWQESSRTRYKNKEFKHIRHAKSTSHLDAFRHTFTLYKPRWKAD